MFDYEGTLKQRGKFVKVKLLCPRYMNRSNSMLVAVPTKNDNIQSSFTTYSEIVMLGKILAQGTYPKSSGFVKSPECIRVFQM